MIKTGRPHKKSADVFVPLASPNAKRSRRRVVMRRCFCSTAKTLAAWPISANGYSGAWWLG